jgi:outer membrane protein
LGPDFRATLQEAEETRPEILAEQARLAATQKGIDLARSSVLPSLVFGFGYHDLRSQTGGRVNEPQAFVGLNIPLYDAGLARGRTAEARALVDRGRTSERLARDQVDRNVQSAFLASVRERDELSVAQQALKAAQMAYDLAKVRYQTGVSSHAGISPLIELSDAQVALTLASQNLVNAEYDTAEAKLAIDYSVGRFAFVNPSLGLGELSAPPKS